MFFVEYYKGSELKGYFKFFKIGDVKKQGVKLFIFIMIAYFYDTHEKQMRRPLDFGIRSADCGMRSAEMGRTLNCEIQNSEYGLRGQFQERLGFFFEIFSSAHFTIFSASVMASFTSFSVISSKFPG